MTNKASKTADGKKHGKKPDEKDKFASKRQEKKISDHSAEEKDNKADDKLISGKETEDKSGKSTKSGKIAGRLEELEKEAVEWKDKYIRLSAEFDNYRKRTLREKADLLKYANEELLKDILPVIDDFERGMENIDKSQDIEALNKGVHLIHSKFSDFIKQKGLKVIEAKDQPFDLDFHEAMTKIPAPSEDLKGKIVDVLEKGYLLNDRVIRFAKVIVGE